AHDGSCLVGLAVDREALVGGIRALVGDLDAAARTAGGEDRVARIERQGLARVGGQVRLVLEIREVDPAPDPSSRATRSACPVEPISVNSRCASRSSCWRATSSPRTLSSAARSTWIHGSQLRAPVSSTRAVARSSASSMLRRAARPSVPVRALERASRPTTSYVRVPRRLAAAMASSAATRAGAVTESEPRPAETRENPWLDGHARAGLPNHRQGASERIGSGLPVPVVHMHPAELLKGCELTERGPHRLSELERAGCVVERRAHVAPASEHFCQIAVDPPEELARLEFACQLGAALEGRCALVEASHLHQRLAPDQKEEDVRHDSENVRTGLRIREGEHERFIRDGQSL